jgi:hypothetical protein
MGVIPTMPILPGAAVTGAGSGAATSSVSFDDSRAPPDDVAGP